VKRHRCRCSILTAVACWSLAAAAIGLPLAPHGRARAQDAPPSADLLRLIRPQPGESLWAEVPWETSLAAACERAVREDKPLFLWRAGGGDVLGRA
jgi:hypothetical protein